VKQRDIYTTEERERVNTGGTGQNNPGWEGGPQHLQTFRGVDGRKGGHKGPE